MRVEGTWTKTLWAGPWGQTQLSLLQRIMLSKAFLWHCFSAVTHSLQPIARLLEVERGHFLHDQLRGRPTYHMLKCPWQGKFSICQTSRQGCHLAFPLLLKGLREIWYLSSGLCVMICWIIQDTFVSDSGDLMKWEAVLPVFWNSWKMGYKYSLSINSYLMSHLN